MPKTTKREETKRATRIARAHSTELPKLEVRTPTERRRSPGYKPPARGIARYPWASVILLCLIALGVVLLYVNHIGPFALSKPAAKKTSHTTASTLRTGASPCTDPAILSKITNTAAAPTTDEISKIKHTYNAAPAQTVDNKKLYCAGLNTTQGLIVFELDPKIAPKTVNNFVYLAQNHFYDGTVFHRVIPDTADYKGQLHIAQGGSPDGSGGGGPGYKFSDEAVNGNYVAGSLAMANSGANTNGSQFFINISDNTKALQKQYNLFGRVVRGMDVVGKIQGPNEVLPAAKDLKPNTTINYLLVTPAS